LERDRFNKVINDFYEANEYLSHVINTIKDVKGNLAEVDKDRIDFHSKIAQRKLIEINDLINFDE
jgi:hypothetical protein